MSNTYVAPNIQASSGSFSSLQGYGVKGQLEALITKMSTATVDPTAAPTIAATGGGASGGLLAAGDYYFVITETNGVGETLASPESAHITVSATNIPRITFPTLKTGNIARNIYVTAADGLTTTEVLYVAGIAAATYDLATAAPTSLVVPPTVNTTAMTARQKMLTRALLNPGTVNPTIKEFLTVVNNFLHGDPISDAAITQLMIDISVAFNLIRTAANEVAKLVFDNPGTLGIGVVAGTGNRNAVRTF